VGAALVLGNEMRSIPPVSVIINFLNAEAFIQEAIESVFAQTYDNWQLLLVDDGSTDTSTDIALRYATQRPDKVRYLEHHGHQNLGASAARNLGCRHAKGKYIAFLDADDVWLPHKLEQQVAILEAHPEVAMVYGPGRWWYSWTGTPEDVRRDYIQKLGVQPNTLLPPPKLLTLFLCHETTVPSSLAILVRRELFERVGGFEEACRSIYDDQILYAKLGLAASVFVADECWYWYRQHPNQRCYVTEQTGQYHAARLAFLNWIEKYLSGQGIKNGEVWTALRKELRPYRYPRWYRLLQRAHRFMKPGKMLVTWTLRQLLPLSAIRWLRAQKQHVRCLLVGFPSAR
jgi:glycosyltransferase involved in cell wall biosynthesis